MHLTLIFLLFLLCFPALHAQDTLTISPRVGKVIDAYEREYFGLFPQAGPFSEAALVYQSGSDRNIDVFIEGSDGVSRSAGVITKDEYRQMGKYIKEFEPILYRMRSHAGTPYIEQKYGNLLGSYLLRRPRPVMDVFFTVSYIDNGRRTSAYGSLLYCDGMYVVLDPDPERHAFNDAIVIPSKVIEEVSTTNVPMYLAAFIIPAFAVGTLVGLAVHSSGVTESGNSEAARMGVTTGLLAGALGLTIAWLTDRSQRNAYVDSDNWKFNVLPGLVEKQFFRHGPPPELRKRLYPER